jgi:addiction module RelE/StbE family toxin
MDVDFTKSFNKQYQKLPTKQQKQTMEAVALFLQDETSPLLRKHGLKGEWLAHYSISAGGDLRLHFRVISDQKVLFVAVGTHSQLYK